MRPIFTWQSAFPHVGTGLFETIGRQLAPAAAVGFASFLR
jgi:hypothetical protein